MWFIKVPQDRGVMVPVIVAWKGGSSTASGSGYNKSSGRCASSIVGNTSLQTTTIAVMADNKEEEECGERGDQKTFCKGNAFPPYSFKASNQVSSGAADARNACMFPKS